MRFGLSLIFLLATACEVTTTPDAAITDAGFVDAGVPDAGSYVAPTIAIERSLFWNDAGILDAPQTLTFAQVLALASDDGHGGRLFAQWFQRFNTTAHSERAMPAQFIDALITAQGSDPTQWNLTTLPFHVTGLHNRIDLAKLEPGGHCGELRISFASHDLNLSPFHVLFLFRQPLGDGDVELDGRVTCAGTARRWAALSALPEAEFVPALRQRFATGLTHERFLLAETVEFTIAPWEWRQWTPAGDGGFDNPPLFQQVDQEKLNVTSPLRDDFLAWVSANAAALDARTILIPERFRPQSVRVNQGVERIPLTLPNNAAFPDLRRNVEIVGCGVCHTVDAEFVQTHADRTISPFYDKELKARAAHLVKLANGEAPHAPFGPLQSAPVLPP